MKRVLFDGTACQAPTKEQAHGYDYSKHFLREAIEAGYVFDIVLYRNYYTPNDVSEILLRVSSDQLKYVENKEQLYQLIDTGDYDTFYSSQPSKYNSYPCNVQFIAVIHGLRKIENPWEKSSWKGESKLAQFVIGNLFPKYMGKIVRRNKIRELNGLLSLPHVKVIAISEHIKYSLLNFFPNLPMRNIRVYYPSFSIKNIYPIDFVGDYFLMTNADRHESNIEMAVRTFDRLFEEKRLGNKHVIITGCQNVDFNGLKKKDKFLFLPHVSNEMLTKLFREAFCFVYPTQHEGFAQSVIKAMACGIPVVSSAISSLPEICSGAVSYFSAGDSDELANRLLQITYNDRLRRRLHDEGIRQASYLMDRQSREMKQYLKFVFE